MEIWAYTSNRMQEYRIHILTSDHVEPEMSPYDFTKDRINHRHK